MVDLKSVAPRALELAEHLVRQRPGFFHAIFLDDWRGVRLIFDSEASRACDNHCDRCEHTALFERSQIQSAVLRATLFEFIDVQDVFLYGPERFLPCKTANRYVRCFVNCIVHDPEMRRRQSLREELELVRDFLVVYNDHGVENDDFARSMKRTIVRTALIRLGERNQSEAERMNAVLEELGWDFTNQCFRR